MRDWMMYSAWYAMMSWVGLTTALHVAEGGEGEGREGLREWEEGESEVGVY